MALSLWRNDNGSPTTLLNDVWGFFDELDRSYQPTRGRAQASLSAPACDVAETSDAYLLTFDVPGLKKEDINIELTGKRLTISGERKREEEFQKGQMIFTSPEKSK